MESTELSLAIREGDCDTIRALLDAGADIHHVRPRGYTAMIEAIYSLAMDDDTRWMRLIRLLIERGADLDGVSDHGESALSVASDRGRFNIVRLLLEAGANPAPLEWNRLMLAVVTGSAEVVREEISNGVDLSERDSWTRTAWLLAVHTGHVATAELLLAAGADWNDRGWRGRTPLLYAIENRHANMVKWLLDKGADPNEADEYGHAALIDAAANGDAESVRLLLSSGADVHFCYYSKPTIHSASSVEVVRLLTQAGADFNDIGIDVRRKLTKQPPRETPDCSLADFLAAKYPEYGMANPERMDRPFWNAMVASGLAAFLARNHFEPRGSYDDPVWCFDRFGKSITELPDGRIVEIAGEHEDYYDVDFCIYNDVIVHQGDGTFEIYGYPPDVFPPTDFHSATLVGRYIYIIGRLGYQGTREFGTTPVYRLDTETFAIEPVETTGTPPGWIHGHRAKLVGCGIAISGGKRSGFADGVETSEDYPAVMVLEISPDGTVWKST